MPTDLGKDLTKVMNTEISKPTLHSKWCSPTGTRIMDILHGVSLLGVLATALWNMVLTIQGNATITTMRPIFIATLIAAFIKIPSQVCAAHGRIGGWMTVVGSVVTVIITSIMLGYLYFDPTYRNDTLEDVCIIDEDGKKWNTQLETRNLNTKGGNACQKLDPDLLGATLAAPQRGGPIPAKDLYRASFNPGHWSPIFQV